ncbi:MAG: hypothetical protein AAFN77_06160 [Planctomycetota bacterium]
MIKKIFGVALACILIGVASLVLGFQNQKRASIVDPEWERVSLRDFALNNYENRCLFKLHGYRIADLYYAYESRSGAIESAYVPLRIPGKSTPSGSDIRVVVKICSLRNEQEIHEKLDRGLISVQYWDEGIPEEAHPLQEEAYPGIQWSNVKLVEFGEEDLPNQSRATLLVVFGGVLILIGVGSGLFLIPISRRSTAANGFSGDHEALLQEDGDSLAAVAIVRSDQSLRQFGYSCLQATPLLLIFNVVISAMMQTGIVAPAVGSWSLIVGGPLFLIAGMIGMGTRYLIAPQFQIEVRTEAEVPVNSMKQLHKEMREFQERGYQLIGFGESNVYCKRYHAFLMKHGQSAVLDVSVSVSTGSVSSLLIGVADNGLLFATGRKEKAVSIDGLKCEIPFVVRTDQDRDPRDTIESFDKFASLLEEEGTTMLRIEPQDVFHVMHYESILMGWWRYYKAMQFAKPEPLPSLTELVRSTARGPCFGFRRDESMDDVFDYRLEPADNPADINPQFSDLVSARFFGQQPTEAS